MLQIWKIAVTNVKLIQENELVKSVKLAELDGHIVVKEIETLQPILPSSYFGKPLKIVEFLALNERATGFPFFDICLTFLTIPVKVASGERSFSKLNLIKSHLRSNMLQDRLNSLAILSIEGDEAKNLNFEVAEQKARHISLSRTDVQTCTYWRAPVIWDGMFNPEYYDVFYRKQNTSVALTVFAVGKYLDTYLKDFLTSAERYFMVGLRVTYYIFTDDPTKVPQVALAPGREVVTLQVERHRRWQDISMMRMKSIADTIESQVRHRAQYVFCLDVDQVFVGRFGTEALGDSVALMHAFFYRTPKFRYTYDQNPKSEAFMEKGDIYYHAAVFGGTWQNVKRLTESCYKGIMKDKENQVEALWHDESHLNKYFWIHKPTKVLSPEYCWAPEIGYRMDLHFPRLVWAEKHYRALRQ